MHKIDVNHPLMSLFEDEWTLISENIRGDEYTLLDDIFCCIDEEKSKSTLPEPYCDMDINGLKKHHDRLLKDALAKALVNIGESIGNGSIELSFIYTEK